MHLWSYILRVSSSPPREHGLTLTYCSTTHSAIEQENSSKFPSVSSVAHSLRSSLPVSTGSHSKSIASVSSALLNFSAPSRVEKTLVCLLFSGTSMQSAYVTTKTTSCSFFTLSSVAV